MEITFSVEHKEANLDLSNQIEIEETLPSYEAAISESKKEELELTLRNYEGEIVDTKIEDITSGSRLDYNAIINDGAVSQSLISELEFNNSTYIGLDDTISVAGYGLYANNGFVQRTTRDNFNNYKRKFKSLGCKKEKKIQTKGTTKSFG